MKLKFNKKQDYNDLDVLNEIVRARLWEDYKSLDCNDDSEELYAAYKIVLEYISVNTDKRLKKLAK